jgi:hypothetical protein
MANSGVAQSPAFSAAASVSKPYQDYRRPPAVSPYMELTRRSSQYNDIDNYNQYVRPRLEQLQESRQMAGQLQGLQTTVRNLNRQTRSVGGIVIPQYYMNYGGYYPGFAR